MGAGRAFRTAALCDAWATVTGGAAWSWEQRGLLGLASTQACRDLDTKAAQALTQAVQRATASLQQEQERTIERIGAEARRQQEALTQHFQRVVDQAAQVRRWLPWKVALLLLGGTLLVNAAGAVWWAWHQAEDLQGLRTHKQLAVGLTHYLANTLYPQLSKAQQRDVDALFKEAGFAPLGPPRH